MALHLSREFARRRDLRQARAGSGQAAARLGEVQQDLATEALFEIIEPLRALAQSLSGMCECETPVESAQGVFVVA